MAHMLQDLDLTVSISIRFAAIAKIFLRTIITKNKIKQDVQMFMKQIANLFTVPMDNSHIYCTHMHNTQKDVRTVIRPN